MKYVIGILLPLIGTSIGASLVYFMRNKYSKNKEHFLLSISAGVMFAASIWSLILPSIEMSGSAVPAIVGFIIGNLFLFFVNKFNSTGDSLSKMIMAIVLHNVPEGMAVGVCFAGALTMGSAIGFSQAIILALGIAIQNIPEGAIISMPLKSKGMSKNKSFFYGVLSGVVEPIFSILTIMFTGLVVPILPYLLGFAAGAMIYVVVEELVPEAKPFKYSSCCFSIGFLIMMILDVIFG